MIKTGTNELCGGSCRARTLAPVVGAIMIICAQQPIPPGYSLDSVTSTPDCRCLGDGENAYVIRKLETPQNGASP